MKLIQKYIDQIKSLCEKHHVLILYVFGSVLNEDFSEKSDVDFLVKFDKVDFRDYFDNYMDLKENLEDLLSKNIDLVEMQTIKNPILKQSIDRTKILIYGREDTEMAV